MSEGDTVVASVGTSPRLDRRSGCMPSVPVDRLIDVSSSISSQLTQLLKMMKERDEERERLRRELQRCREQLHVMHESKRREKQESQSDSHLQLENENTATEEELSNSTSKGLNMKSLDGSKCINYLFQCFDINVSYVSVALTIVFYLYL